MSRPTPTHGRARDRATRLALVAGGAATVAVPSTGDGRARSARQDHLPGA